jgi:uncharacterized protein YciI
MSDPKSIYLVDIEYIAETDAVMAQLDAHMEFVGAGFGRGDFLVAGRKMPRTGGIFLARGPSKTAVEELMATDPFATSGVAQITVTEFWAGTVQDGLAVALDQALI